MKTFVIAEAGSSHDNDLAKAYRLIEAAKACDADAVKFQYWSSSRALATRRGIPQAESKYESCRLPQSWLLKLHDHCSDVGIEFMCSTFLIEDIATIAPLVKRFKVSAFESGWTEFMRHHYPYGMQVITSVKADSYMTDFEHPDVSTLYCVSKYPTPLEDLKLRSMWDKHRGSFFVRHSGLSDHTANPLVGALAVAAGATIIESHIRLNDTDPTNPDYPHSLSASKGALFSYAEYVANIRLAERCL